MFLLSSQCRKKWDVCLSLRNVKSTFISKAINKCIRIFLDHHWGSSYTYVLHVMFGAHYTTFVMIQDGVSEWAISSDILKKNCFWQLQHPFSHKFVSSSPRGVVRYNEAPNFASEIHVRAPNFASKNIGDRCPNFALWISDIIPNAPKIVILFQFFSLVVTELPKFFLLFGEIDWTLPQILPLNSMPGPSPPAPPFDLLIWKYTPWASSYNILSLIYLPFQTSFSAGSAEQVWPLGS